MTDLDPRDEQRVRDITEVAFAIIDQLADSEALDQLEREMGRAATEHRLSRLFERYGVQVAGAVWLIWAKSALLGRPENTWAPQDGSRMVEHARAVVELARADKYVKVGDYVSTVLREGGTDLLWQVSAALAVAAARTQTSRRRPAD